MQYFAPSSPKKVGEPNLVERIIQDSIQKLATGPISI